MVKEYIRKPTGMTLGTVETEPNGDKTVKDYAGRILGYYKAGRNQTTTVTGRTVAQGDCAVAFLFVDLDKL